MIEAGETFNGQISDAARSRAASLVGRTLAARYHLESLIALGGIAAVFRATRVEDGEVVAVKVLHPDAEGLPELVLRFEREAIAGKHILHPNVAVVREFTQLGDGSSFLVQEYVAGVTLRRLIDGGPIAPLRAARIAHQIAAALNAAHDMGIVHRDVKPLNVMIAAGTADAVKLIDFGLAKVPVHDLALAEENARASLTAAGVVVGTVAYLPPEAALGMRNVDRRSDLYALGVILFEMLAGKHPFSGRTPAELFRQQRLDPVPRIAKRSPGVRVPTGLEAIVRRLLEKDPANRYQHARAVMVALETEIASIEAVGGRGTSRLVSRFAARGRPALALAVAVVALFAVALVSVVSWVLAAPSGPAR